MDKFWTMSNIDVYEILCPIKTAKYKATYGKIYDKEQVIYLKERVNEKIYLVSKGKVKLVNYNRSGEEIFQNIVTKGELFGINSIFGDYRHNEYAVSACNQTSVCSIDITKLQQLMMENLDFSTTIYKCVANNRRKICRRLELLIGKDVNTRVAAFIYDLYMDSQQLTIRNSLTQNEMAKLLATSRESVARILNDLRGKGVIEYNRNSIQIKNLSSLRLLSQAA